MRFRNPESRIRRQERRKERRSFFLGLTKNLKWIFISLAIIMVVVFGFYLVMTYGGGSILNLKSLLLRFIKF